MLLFCKINEIQVLNGDVACRHLALAFFCVYIKGLWNTMIRQHQGSQPREFSNVGYHLTYRAQRLGFVRLLTGNIDILNMRIAFSI